MVNAPLMFKTLDHIDAHPDEYNQGEWATKGPCGTVACFAGTAVMLAGHEFDFRYEDVDATDVVKDGRSIREVARLELGLTFDQGEVLFYGGNSLDDVRELVHAYTAELVAAT